MSTASHEALSERCSDVEQPIEAVFISDLHLHPGQPEITDRFCQFVQWAARHTRKIYILGDFFHVWAGDDAMNPWSEWIAERLKWLTLQGCRVYFMVGNRDFLLGQQFAQQAGWTVLPDPSLITLEGQQILLTHGDRYCTHDKAHQWLRCLTRNRLFKTLFLSIPLSFRQHLVTRVRDYSQNNRKKQDWRMAITVPALIQHLRTCKVRRVIHGHIHHPGVTQHQADETIYQQFVLSDWDDKPKILCYYKSSGFQFDLIERGGYA